MPPSRKRHDQVRDRHQNDRAARDSQRRRRWRIPFGKISRLNIEDHRQQVEIAALMTIPTPEPGSDWPHRESAAAPFPPGMRDDSRTPPGDPRCNRQQRIRQIEPSDSSAAKPSDDAQGQSLLHQEARQPAFNTHTRFAR